jgi:U3 small nucleolar RNA-associated protein 3
MAKKRKASSRPYGQPEVQGVRDADARIKPIQTFEDVADSEDEFHVNRDKILLEDTVDQKGRERWEEEGSFTRYVGVVGLGSEYRD